MAEAAAEAASSEAVLRDSEKFVNDLANTEFDPSKPLIFVAGKILISYDYRYRSRAGTLEKFNSC